MSKPHLGGRPLEIKYSLYQTLLGTYSRKAKMNVSIHKSQVFIKFYDNIQNFTANKKLADI